MRPVPCTPLLALPLLCAPSTAQGHGLHLSQCAVERGEGGDRVVLDIGWPNAWCNERNRDGVWLVLRGDARRGPLRLRAEGHEQREGRPAVRLDVAEDHLGLFVSPGGPHRGDVRWRLVLALDEPAPEHVVAFCVQMVLVPGGPFEAGDDHPVAVRLGAFHRAGDDGGPEGPYAVDSEAEIPVGREPGALCYRTHEYRGDLEGPIPAAWPKGTRPFWIMKYELTQGDYAAFLSALPPEWQASRRNDAPRGQEAATCSIEHDGRGFTARAPDRPCNFVSWADTCAWLDWLALRPMTELEYEKAARGPRRPVPLDRPWGTDSCDGLARVVQPSRDLAAAGAEAERQLTDATRARFGASFWWVLDLSGSLWERVVTAGHPAGRAFCGSHGDGALAADGTATNADWPRTGADGRTADGIGYRGGAEYFARVREDDPTNPNSPVAVRTYGAWNGAERYKTYGGRGVRTAPGAPCREPSDAERQALRAELLERGARDQEIRSVDLPAMNGEERRAWSRRAEQVDGENTARMIEIVATFGWPTHAMVGKEASDAAFLLVQHADRDPDFQARCLPLLAAAAERGEASKRGVAYLTDRVAVKQGRPQVYGTQYLPRLREDGSVAADDQGRFEYLMPLVVDPERLDERRSTMGLGPWRDYERRMAELQQREPQERPRAWDGRLPVDHGR